jgi:hypothetical protein
VNDEHHDERRAPLERLRADMAAGDGGDWEELQAELAELTDTAGKGEVWENEIGPLLTSAQVRELLISRRSVSELLKDRRLIGLRDGAGRLLFPAFQLDSGRPLDPLVRAYWTVADAAVSGWTAASWCVAPDEALGGKSPAEWARGGGDADRLAIVARQDAARLVR